ncbi:unnamed protein product [Rotaria sp. Silwood1]|nr:unnamed protein product [Rotaria sp. Silwood1]
MIHLVTIVIVICLSIANGQECHATFDQSIVGYCSSADKCQGTLLFSDICERQLCCISGQAPAASPVCVTGGEFNALYSTPRAGFLRRVLNRAINQAEICDNCHAKAAFLAISAAMTNNFTSDEVIGTDAQFNEDDNKYGNDRPGDGSRFRRRGFFGLRGRQMYQRLQTLMPQYQSVSKPESVAIVENAMEIAARQWKNPNLLNETTLTPYADGTFYGFLMLWYKLDGDISQLADAVKQYLKFLRAMDCDDNLNLGERPQCRYNETHYGYCTPDCITGLEDFGEYCGCRETFKEVLYPSQASQDNCTNLLLKAGVRLRD